MFAIAPLALAADEISDAEEIDIPAVETKSAQLTYQQQRKVFQYRGYLVSELGFIPNPKSNSLTKGSGIGEANLAFTYRPLSSISLFSDTLASYFAPSANTQLIFAQAGLRIQPTETISLAFGRERNFRAPGLLINPSDIIHPSQNVPGQRMQRAGVWLARASYQTRPLTIDAMFLPYNNLTANGLPFETESKDFGGVGRLFLVTGIGDFGVTGGYFNQLWQLGTFYSSYLVRKLETHAELGISQSQRARALIGSRLDIGSSSSFTLEGYFNNRGLSKDEFEAGLKKTTTQSVSTQAFSGSATASFNLFPRRWYTIASVSSTDILNLFNLSLSEVLGLEDFSSLTFFRWDWLVSDQSTLALLLIAIHGPRDGQYGARPLDYRWGAEWRINF